MILRQLAALGLAAAPLLAQAEDMPAEMRNPSQEFSSSTLQLELEAPTDLRGVTLYARFNTEERRIWLDVVYRDHEGSTNGMARVSEEFTLGFMPTVLAQEAEIGTSFFVVGYTPRVDRVNVQRWSLENIATTRTPSPTGSHDLLGLTFDVVAEPVWLGARLHDVLPGDGEVSVINPDAVGYISGAAFHVTSQRLWMIEEMAPSRIWALDPESLDLVELTSEVTWPDLATAKLLAPMWIDPSHGSGGGMVILASTGRVWTELEGLPDVPAVVFQDADLDGLSEIVFETSVPEVYELGYVESSIDYQVSGP